MADGDTINVRIETVHWNGHGRIALIGELDLANVGDTESALAAQASRGTPLVLDLARLTYLDSQGIAMLLRLSDRATLNGGSLSVANPSRMVRRVLDITDCVSVIPIIDDGVDPPTAR